MVSEMLQEVMENLVESGMRFNKWKNRNKNVHSGPKVPSALTFQSNLPLEMTESN